MLKKQKKLVFNNLCLGVILIASVIACSKPNVAGKLIGMTLFEVNIDTSNSNKVITYEDSTGQNGYIYVSNIDTIRFNFGYDINNLAEHDPPVFFFPYPTDTITLDTSVVDPKEVVFTKKINFDIDEFRKQNVYFDTISGLFTKITMPRRIANGGITGMYIDSIKSDYGGRLKFNFFTMNLDSLKQERMLKVMRSIRLKVK